MSEYITTDTGSHVIVQLPPAPPVAPPESFAVSKLAFKGRFPNAKWRAARGASSLSADLADFFEDFDLAKYMDLQDPRTVAAITSLSDAAVPAEFRLTQAEVDAILNTPCQPGEAP